MSPPSCQVEHISIIKDLIPNYEIQTILDEQISKAYPNYRKIYTDGSVQSKRAGAEACILSLNLNIYSPLPLGSSILSAELCAIHLALDAIISYNMKSDNILCLSDSKTALLLIQNTNRIANDKDLFNIRRQLLNLRIKGNGAYFQNVPIHRGIKYNDRADSPEAKAFMLIPSPSSDLNLQDIIRQRSNVNDSKLILSPFHTRLNTVLYYRLKSGALLLSSLLFNWKLHHSLLCRVCFSADETIQHILFDCQAQSEETIALKRFCSLAKIPNTYTAILDSNLPWEIDRKIFKAAIDIL